MRYLMCKDGIDLKEGQEKNDGMLKIQRGSTSGRLSVILPLDTDIAFLQGMID